MAQDQDISDRELPGYRELRAADWKKAINSKVIRYFLYIEPEQEVSGIDTDFEVAMQVWLKLLHREDVQVKKVSQRSEADIVIHIGKKSVANRFYFSDHPAHTTFVYNWLGQHRYVPMIEFNSKFTKNNKTYRWISIPEARSKNAVVRAKVNAKPQNISVNQIFGRSDNLREISSNLIGIKDNITYWDMTKIGDEQCFLLYNVLIHELGHVFGLKDMYDLKTKLMLNNVPTVMGNMEHIQIHPAPQDILVVQSIFELDRAAVAK